MARLGAAGGQVGRGGGERGATMATPIAEVQGPPRGRFGLGGQPRHRGAWSVVDRSAPTQLLFGRKRQHSVDLDRKLPGNFGPRVSSFRPALGWVRTELDLEENFLRFFSFVTIKDREGWTENPCVGGSIPPLATTSLSST